LKRIYIYRKEDCTNLVSSPRHREEIDYRGIELAAGQLQMVSSHLHRQSKTEKGQDFAETFRQFNKLQVNGFTRVITGMKPKFTLKI
jgi:hypothetical protein